MDYEANGTEGSIGGAGFSLPEGPSAAIPLTAAAAAAANAIQLTPAADNTLVLPAGVTLDNVTVQGRDLVITAPDGQVYVVHDGAVFVPTLVIDGVSVPPMNLAALLVGTEVQPAAGPVQSSGNNFEEQVGAIQDSYALGNLLDYSEFGSAEAGTDEVIPFADFEATASIVNRNSAAGTLAATDTVSEAGLPAREGEPAGSAPSAATTTVTGTLVFSTPDGLQSITVNGVVVTGAGQTISGEYGTLTITSFAGGELGYSYVLGDNALTPTAAEPFVFVVTDLDGDTATATLTIDIVDDVPVARNDSDALAAGTFGPQLGNVITGVGTTDGAAGADTQGADGATVTRIASVNVAANADTTFDGSGILTVAGQYGTLSINAGGTYSYVRNAGTPGGVADVFSYTLTDGDGDAASATLTINLGDAAPTAAIAATGSQASANATAAVSEAGLPPHGGLPAGSAESADGNPGNNSNTGETTTGTIQFTAVDGLQGVTINGTLVTGVGQTIATPKGVLTITSASATSYGYSYSLTTNTSGDATTDVLTVAITDGDGDVATATLTIAIADDVPTARADTDVLAAGNYGPETGNVITGASTTSGTAGADTQGADGAAISGIASNNLPANTDTSFDGSGNLVVAGQYGTLSIKADGSYSYVRTPGTSGGVSDLFTYTLTDGDGDVRTATLTIDITDSATSLIVITPENSEGEGGAGSANAFTTVREGGLPPHGLLPAGSDEAADGNPDNNSVPSETTTGSIVYTAPDGPAEVTINGVAVTAANQTFVTAKGVLTITSIAPGSIGYSYSLTVNTQGENTHDDFAIGVTDIDGDHSDATLTINIVDDMPFARGDTDFVAAGKFTAETGNVITGTGTTSGTAGSDFLGADGGGISGIASVNVAGNSSTTFNGSGNLVVTGQYGTLSIKADGSYSYVRAFATPGGVTDTFTYTLTDGDGDPVTANLAIAIGNSTPTLTNLTPEGPEGTGGDVVVNEDDLPNGSDTSKELLTQTGTFTVTSPDGIQTLSIDGHAVVSNGVFTAGSWATTGLGNTLTVISFSGGVLTYSYTLTAAETHANAAGTNSLYESLPVVLTDLDGQTANGALVARVIDDIAAARADTDALAVGVFTPETGNVITGTGTTSGAAGVDTPGADGASITRVASVNLPANSDTTFEAGNLVVAGQYGVLTIKANGDYSYVRNPGSAGGVSDQFSYTLTDADGDPATSTLTIGIADGTPSFLNLTPKGSGGDVSVDEDDLPAGSDTSKELLTQTGDFTVSSPDGVKTHSIAGHDVVVNGAFTAQSWITVDLH
jgi:VCBS repeat-containing protein